MAVGLKRRFVSRENETEPLDPLNLSPWIDITIQITRTHLFHKALTVGSVAYIYERRKKVQNFHFCFIYKFLLLSRSTRNRSLRLGVCVSKLVVTVQPLSSFYFTGKYIFDLDVVLLDFLFGFPPEKCWCLVVV
jgi:hypothetical protein